MVDLSEDEELLAELGVELETAKEGGRTPREERIIAGFEDIRRFVDAHGRAPRDGEDRDIFERLYAVRLDRIRESEECRALVAAMDRQGLLDKPLAASERLGDDLDDDALLAELGVEADVSDDISVLKHVRSREEINAAEEIANRTRCADFDSFKPLFAQVQKDLDCGSRQTRRFQRDAEIKLGDFFILGGQKAYVAEMGEEFRTEQDRRNARLRVIFDNGTESNALLRSFQRALYKDDLGRRITEPDAGPLFTQTELAEGNESGTIYVLRSKSVHPTVAANRDVIHKIGVTGGDLDKRIANASLDATFLLAEVETIASYTLFNINRIKLENLLHRFFSAARMDLEIKDRFGIPVKPREWFIVPLPTIDEVVKRIQDGTIVKFEYDPASASLRKRAEVG
jgi:hypothetical protein